MTADEMRISDWSSDVCSSDLLDLPPFTLIGATTRAGLLTAPLRDRFGIVQRLEFYSAQDLTRIVKRSAQILGIDCVPEGAGEIARRSRGTRSEEHTSELQSLMRISYAVFCLKNKKKLESNHLLSYNYPRVPMSQTE